MKIALAQINPVVSDFSGNSKLMLDAAERAASLGADLVVFPEISLMGYPPRDLVEQKSFVNNGLRALDGLSAKLPLPAIIGFVSRNETGTGKSLHNSAALVAGGGIVSVHHKTLLPTYDVFDERRYFEPGGQPRVAELCGRKLGITICKDIWSEEGSPVAELAAQGAEVIVNLSASPFTLGKIGVRRQLLSDRARAVSLPMVYVNQVGGNDELLFDGGSMVVNAAGEVVALAKRFEEDLLLVDMNALPDAIQNVAEDTAAAAFSALALGTRDYLHKCGFKGAVIGLSGGIDSALTAAVAVDALGAENVLGVAMPSRYSSESSISDARELAANLGIRFLTIPIEPTHEAFTKMLEPVFQGLAPDVTEENIQARIRGATLMALSNKLGMLLLATGNKSELVVGYCTLYGDMCGGLAPLSDVPKTMVYDISRWLNRDREVIPASTISKAPSAELRPDQTDQQTLPPYDVLDRILRLYIEESLDLEDIVASGIERDVVEDVVRRIELAEYKRRQAVPGIKITSKAFGCGRRVPTARNFLKN